MPATLSTTAIRALLGKLTADAAKTIAGQTNASPAVVNVTAHGFAVGDVVAQFGDTGNTNLNGVFQVATVPDADHYTLTDLRAGTQVNGNGVSAGSPKAIRVTCGWVPHDVANIDETLQHFSYARGTDKDASNESTIRSIFGL